MKLKFSLQIVEISWNVIFHEDLSIESLDIEWGQTEMKKLVVAFRKFANAPEKSLFPSLLPSIG